MTPLSHPQIQELVAGIGDRFAVAGNFIEGAEIPTGHINTTYRASYQQEDGGTRRYIIQAINHHVFKDPYAVMRNVETVTRHINARVLRLKHDASGQTLSLIPARDGRPWVEDGQGTIWRCYNFIEGCVTCDIVENPRQAYQDGVMISGIHQDGVLKARDTYEIMRAEDVGWATNKIVLGKLSGRNAFKQRLSDLGIELASESEVNAAFAKFKELADRKSEIFDEDITALVMDESVTAEQEHYRLLALSQHSEMGERPHATVAFAAGADEFHADSDGNGPVDASLKAIESKVQSGAELVLYSVNAITSGSTESQGEVTVRLQLGGRVVNGVGADPDIVVASAKAYLAALNKLHSKNDRVAAQVEHSAARQRHRRLADAAARPVKFTDRVPATLKYCPANLCRSAWQAPAACSMIGGMEDLNDMGEHADAAPATPAATLVVDLFLGLHCFCLGLPGALPRSRQVPGPSGLDLAWRTESRRSSLRQAVRSAVCLVRGHADSRTGQE